jgi:hypothetical protein
VQANLWKAKIKKKMPLFFFFFFFLQTVAQVPACSRNANPKNNELVSEEQTSALLP